MVKVIVFFLLIQGGSVKVERDKDVSILNDEECFIMATDVMNELLGPARGLPPAVDMTKVKAVRYNCWWIV